jgi:predicted TIM-barrel fold metal-dependent hydrolase
MSPLATVPPDAWDTHIHVFNPKAFPYGVPRSYTPKAAALKEYPHGQTQCTNLLIVQATVQGQDVAPLLDAISTEARNQACGLVRGLATLDPSQFSETELNALSAAGVRGIRMHEMSWGHGPQSSANNIAKKIEAAGPKLAGLGWIVDIFTDVRTWAALDGVIRNQLDPRVKLVADHCGGAFPGDENLAEFQVFIQLIRDGYLNVKLSGFERLYHKSENGIESLAPIVKAIIAAGPEKIVYGSG